MPRDKKQASRADQKEDEGKGKESKRPRDVNPRMAEQKERMREPREAPST